MFLGYIIHSLLTVISFTGLQLRANETSTDLTTESTIKITPIPEITVPTDLSTEATELTTEFTEPTFDAPEFTADATELTTDAAIEVENERASETFTSTQVQNRAVLMGSCLANLSLAILLHTIHTFKIMRMQFSY